MNEYNSVICIFSVPVYCDPSPHINNNEASYIRFYHITALWQGTSWMWQTGPCCTHLSELDCKVDRASSVPSWISWAHCIFMVADITFWRKPLTWFVIVVSQILCTACPAQFVKFIKSSMWQDFTSDFCLFLTYFPAPRYWTCLPKIGSTSVKTRLDDLSSSWTKHICTLVDLLCL